MNTGLEGLTAALGGSLQGVDYVIISYVMIYCENDKTTDMFWALLEVHVALPLRISLSMPLPCQPCCL